MPHYRFHVADGDEAYVDPEGIDLEDFAAALAHARTIIGDIVREDVRDGSKSVHVIVMIDDQTGVRIGNIQSIVTTVETITPFAE